MRVGLISGIHEDILRLHEAIAVLHGYGCASIICLGDLVGYSVPYYGFLASRNAHDVIALVRTHCAIVVAGNHDLFAVRRVPHQQAVFPYPADWYALDSFQRRERAQGQVFLYDDDLPAQLTRADEAYLRALPEYRVAQYDDLTCMFSHFAYPDLLGDSRTFDPAVAQNLQPHFAFMAAHGCALGLSGHEGYDGIGLYTQTARHMLPFGVHVLPHEPVWVHGPWVANDTYANGVMVLDISTRELQVVPLNTPKHVVPRWQSL